MMFPSHLLGALLLGGLLSLWRPFTPRDWRLALGFAVVIDLDHAIQFPRYLLAAGVQGLEPHAMLAWGDEWQGFMHDPAWALPIAIGAGLLFRSLVPVAFWLLHMLQDFVIATRFVDFGSAMEWEIIAALALAVAAVFALDHRRSGNGAPLLAHLAQRFGVPYRAASAGAAARADAP